MFVVDRNLGSCCKQTPGLERPHLRVLHESCRRRFESTSNVDKASAAFATDAFFFVGNWDTSGTKHHQVHWVIRSNDSPGGQS